MTRSWRVAQRFVLCAAAGFVMTPLAHGAAATAQRPDSIIVRVRVTDTTAAPLAGAEVSIVRGLNTVLAASATDGTGWRTFAVAHMDGDYQLIVRRIGFQRVDRFFQPGDRDTVAFAIVARRTIQTLEAVRVVEREDVRRKSYHIDADEIANSTRTILDATDIVAKLRPDMICGRNCSPLRTARARTTTPTCPRLVFQQRLSPPCYIAPGPPAELTNVWVNGRRIRMTLVNEMAAARQSGILGGLSPGTMTVLSEIRPEHIAEINYLDSTDNTVGKVGSSDAIFIVLKPGVAYEPGKGSYVAEQTAVDAAVRQPSSPAAFPPYRYRLLGVFDGETGEPIAGAEVLDLGTGTKALTTLTGTVTLVFLPEGGSPVRISKRGYEEASLVVEISPEETNGITVVLTKHRD